EMRMTSSRSHFAIVLLLCAVMTPAAAIAADTDHDGLSDELEQKLLDQFTPVFMLDKADCAGVPVAFEPNRSSPVVAAENGTVYGQVFPLQGQAAPTVEIHFYHLWGRACGPHGHRLDAA